MKRFLYLFQVPGDLPTALRHAESADSDVLFVSYRSKSSDPRSMFYPSSSWTQGRNRLFKAALGLSYDYLIFGDGDILFDPRGARAVGKPATDGVAGITEWRMFENFLRTHEPAVGTPYYEWHLPGSLEPGVEVQTVRHFDAILNAFHREALLPLLPYYDLMDEQDTCYAQNILCSLAADLYPGQVLQTNGVRVVNTQSARGGREAVYSVPENFYLDSLRDPVRRRGFSRLLKGPGARHPGMGPPKSKAGTVAVSDQRLAEMFHLDHPIWARKRELLDLQVNDEFFSESIDTTRARRWRAPGQPGATVPPPESDFHKFLRVTRPLRRRLGLVRGQPLRMMIRRWGHRIRPARPRRNVNADSWHQWVADPQFVLRLPETRRHEATDLIAAALNRAPGDHIVFVDVGAGNGDALHELRQTCLAKPVLAVGVDPVQTQTAWRYGGFAVGSFNLAALLQQFGLSGEVLHYVRVGSQGSDADVLSLGHLMNDCLFLRLMTPGMKNAAVDVRRAIGAAGFRLFNASPIDVAAEADLTFVNVRLLEALLPNCPD